MIRLINMFPAFKSVFAFALLFLMITVPMNTLAFSPSPSVDPLNTIYDDPCYQGSALDNIPTHNLPNQENWLNWQTGVFIVTQGPSYHMVHDVIANPGQNLTIVGKFDYGAVFHKDLEDEDIHVYLFGTGQTDWQYIGRYRTNSDGKITVSLPPKDVGEYMIKMVVAGDLSEANGFINIVEPNRKAVVFDIDGTLTQNSAEMIGDYTNVSIAKAYNYSIEVTKLYKKKGYQLIFLTARPYWVARDTREWYDIKGFPDTTITRFSMSNETIINAEQYKSDFMAYLIDTIGLDVIRVYGNAQSDIDAYENAGIPKSDTYIIGPNAGNSGTMPLTDDYERHYNWLLDTLNCSED